MHVESLDMHMSENNISERFLNFRFFKEKGRLYELPHAWVIWTYPDFVEGGHLHWEKVYWYWAGTLMYN